jgi:hypothetical protein
MFRQILFYDNYTNEITPTMTVYAAAGGRQRKMPGSRVSTRRRPECSLQ